MVKIVTTAPLAVPCLKSMMVSVNLNVSIVNVTWTVKIALLNRKNYALKVAS